MSILSGRYGWRTCLELAAESPLLAMIGDSMAAAEYFYGSMAGYGVQTLRRLTVVVWDSIGNDNVVLL